MTAVCDLFLAPKGIASGGGHGNSLATFETSRSALGGEETLSGWFDAPAGFFMSGLTLGGFALS